MSRGLWKGLWGQEGLLSREGGLRVAAGNVQPFLLGLEKPKPPSYRDVLDGGFCGFHLLLLDESGRWM